MEKSSTFNSVWFILKFITASVWWFAGKCENLNSEKWWWMKSVASFLSESSTWCTNKVGAGNASKSYTFCQPKYGQAMRYVWDVHINWHVDYRKIDIPWRWKREKHVCFHKWTAFLGENYILKRSTCVWNMRILLKGIFNF